MMDDSTSIAIEAGYAGRASPTGGWRFAALDAGLPVTLPRCSSTDAGFCFQATIDAPMRRQMGMCDLVIAGGRRA